MGDETMPRNATPHHPVDCYVGGRVRFRRTMIGMSQEKLGERSGITFQQIQKYEKGANRISASRLVQFAAILGTPVAWFFDGLPEDIAPGVAMPPVTDLDGTDIALVRRFSCLSVRTKRALVRFADALAEPA